VGSVGSQALLGIPRLHALRWAPALGAASRVWPFETGFALPRGRPLVLYAEVWPGSLPAGAVVAECAATGAIRDQAQVRLLGRWAAALDAEGALAALFGPPRGVDAAGQRAARDEEAWILGASSGVR
jgi:hypothetical protein